MTKDVPPIIQANELQELYNSENLVIVDVSTGKEARANYEAKHLDGALFVDLNTQLSNIKEDASMGGRHPLPTMEHFSKTLTNLGITEESHVVVYDDKYGANAAARFWWMLKAIGHDKVQVLDGGWQEAEKQGLPVSSKPESARRTIPYKVRQWILPLSSIDEVEKVSQDENHIVIDVRESDRYNGLTEPIDLVAGHIPGAVNVPFQTNLNDQGLFLSPQELKIKYLAVFENVAPENVIVHCGSGVTACHTLLAIAHGGLEIPKLYVGSWSEWSRNDKPMATQEF
ncbi:MAG: sulfurtransferase [Bacteroidetes bacterium]|nr:sulfurtransferase [Bacteroidota bacterium]MDA1121553.1 sulfurtransferase [Bacteroidota bacterium]